jgi:hypothetical protein
MRVALIRGRVAIEPGRRTAGATVGRMLTGFPASLVKLSSNVDDLSLKLMFFRPVVEAGERETRSPNHLQESGMNLAGISRAFACALAGAAATAALFVVAPAHAATVTIEDGGACASWNWNASLQTLSCNAGSLPPPPSPSFACSFSPAPGAAQAGQALGVTVACTGGTATAFAWSATAPAGCQGNCTATWGSGGGSNNVTLPSAGIWTLRANVTSSTGASAQAQASVQVNAVVGGGGTNLCAAQGYAKTIFYNWDWSGGPVSRLDTLYMSDMAGGTSLGTNGILVVAFKPTGPAEFNNITAVSATGYPAPNMINNLTLAISTQPCDLNPPAPAVSSSTTPSVSYAVGTVPTYWSTGAKVAVELQPGVQYYLNVAGRDADGTQTCTSPYPGWNCDVRMSLQKPLGH